MTNSNTKVDHVTPDMIVEKYIALRNKKKELVELHKQQLAPYDQAMSACENAMLDMLHKQGVQSFKTQYGTAFQQTATYVQLTDRQALLDWVIELPETRLDIFTNAVSKEAVIAHTEDKIESIQRNGQPPPGVTITRETVVHFRKA